jgi:predicted short-subunit dehydrogenase-like oxidoreductase (DUF2520 family)
LVAASPSVAIIGRGRAGQSLERALEAAAFTPSVELVVLAVPDDVIAEVAASLEPRDEVVVAHLAGSLGLDVLAPHARRASMHPLRSIPTMSTDLTGAWWAVVGDPVVRSVVAALDGRVVEVDDASRAAYHAAAVMASNHVVALLGAVERVAASAGVPLDAFFDLVRGTVDNVALLGPAAALTGPVARGDWATVERHLASLPDDETRALYTSLSHGCVALAPRVGAEAEG